MSVDLIARDDAGVLAVPVSAIVFETLADRGMDRMTEGRVEFVLCASALTAQV